MATTGQLGIVLRAAGTALVLDVSDGGLPAVVHWGADCGPLTPKTYASLLSTGVLPTGASEPDEPVRISILPEHTNGWFGKPGVSGSRGGRAWSPLWDVTGALLDGRDVLGTGLVESGAGSLVVTATDTAAELGLTLTVELSSAGIVRTRANLTNLGATSYQLDELLLTLPVPGHASEVLDFAGRWGKERVPQRHNLTVGTYRREGRRGRTGLDSALILNVGEPGFGFARGEVWGVHTGWSGNHIHQIDRVLTGVQLLGGGELLLPGEMILATDESYESPWVYGIYGDGLDDSARRMHNHMRARSQHPQRVRPVTLNVWEAVYFDHNLETLLELADHAAEVGIERFVLDDGWFGGRRGDKAGLGDWFVSPDAWPTGLEPLISHVRAKGMEFGLWFEPEMINEDSDLARSHPEWIMATGDQLPVEARHQQVLNLGIPECYDHIFDSMCKILDTHDIAYIKWDHNRDLVDAGTRPDGSAGTHNQTLAFYRLVADLKQRYPSLEFESCSSGGGRVDLGALDQTDRIWVSDNNDPLDRTQINRWTTQLLPPELMGTHIASGASHTTGRSHSLSFRAQTAFFGHLGVEWDLRQAGDEDRAALTAWISLYKESRELLHTGQLVRLDHPDPAVNLHGVVAADGSGAIFSYSALATATTSNPGRIRTPGLVADAVYRVEPILIGDIVNHLRPAPWWDDAPVEVTGAMLATVGMAVPALHPEHGILIRMTRV